MDHHRLSLCKHTLERLAGLVGAYWLDRDEQEVERHRLGGDPPAMKLDAPPERCVIFADGVMVHTDGDWHEARVGTIRSETATEDATPRVVRSEERRVGKECVRTGRSRGAAYH